MRTQTVNDILGGGQLKLVTIGTEERQVFFLLGDEFVDLDQDKLEAIAELYMEDEIEDLSENVEETYREDTYQENRSQQDTYKEDDFEMDDDVIATYVRERFIQRPQRMKVGRYYIGSLSMSLSKKTKQVVLGGNVPRPYYEDTG